MNRWYGSLCCVLLWTHTAGAGAKPLVIDVWPGKVPGETTTLAEMFQEKRADNIRRLTNVSKPTLTIYKPAKDKDTGSACLIFPGGAYNILAWDLEGEEVAEWLQSLGVTAIVLKYRVPRPPGSKDIPIGPLQDAQRALSLVRHHGKEWGIDSKRIGVLGFSAGGHLAASAATRFDKRVYDNFDAIDQHSCRPDFAVLIYPAYLVVKDSYEMAPDITVTKDCPPTFFAHASDDPIKPDNSAVMYLALRRAGVHSELHIYASGGHGFGMRPSQHPCSTWPKRCEEWLKTQNLLKAQTGN